MFTVGRRFRVVAVGIAAFALLAVAAGGTLAASTPTMLYACFNTSGAVAMATIAQCKLSGGGQLVGFNTSGPTGPQGATGATGATGPTGPTGANGALSIESSSIGGAEPPPAQAGSVFTYKEQLDCPSVPYAHPLGGGASALIYVNGAPVAHAALLGSEDDLEGGWRAWFGKPDGSAFTTSESLHWEISLSCLKTR